MPAPVKKVECKWEKSTVRVRKFAVFAFCVLCLCLAFCVLCLEAVFSNIMFFSIKSLS